MDNDDINDKDKQPKAAKDPVKKWTRIVLILAFVLMIWYLAADRNTPYTTQARLHAQVVPIAAEVSGPVTEVAVSNNQVVAAGDTLFSVDAGNYEIALENARANLETARQSTGASEAGVDAAEAQLGAARANERRSEQDATRLRRIKGQDPGAISDRRLESAEAALDIAREQVTAAEAQLESARRNLGQTGDDNSHIRQARAAVDKARLDIDKTTVLAPVDGLVTDVRVEVGKFAGAGSPLLTFVATQDIWIQADFTENNLGNVQRGDPVEILFDVFPGRVFKGTVRGMGFGVDVDKTQLGSLPTINNDREWLRDAQRFPVDVEFDMAPEDKRKLRVGAQASVIIYTSDSFVLKAIGKLQVRIATVLSYAY
ncbi:MAG: HlyD family secretion protein [Woeseiaceae bacterium]